MRILILGGNRFFGKKLARDLLHQGHEVTLLNRGNVDDGFGDDVGRIRCDREDTDQLRKLVSGKTWDFVYDQVCFDYRSASAACDIFKGKARRYIFTSSQSVYGLGKSQSESDFDPSSYTPEKFESKSSDYAEAKRQAETAFAKLAPFLSYTQGFPSSLATTTSPEDLSFI